MAFIECPSYFVGESCKLAKRFRVVQECSLISYHLSSGRIGDRRQMITSRRNFRASTGRLGKPRLHGITEIRGPYHSVIESEHLQVGISN